MLSLFTALILVRNMLVVKIQLHIFWVRVRVYMWVYMCVYVCVCVCACVFLCVYFMPDSEITVKQKKMFISWHCKGVFPTRRTRIYRLSAREWFSKRGYSWSEIEIERTRHRFPASEKLIRGRRSHCHAASCGTYFWGCQTLHWKKIFRKTFYQCFSTFFYLPGGLFSVFVGTPW